MAKDVIVVVQRDALPTTKESLDILLVSTTGAQPVQVYRDVASVEAVYGPNGPTPNSKVVRKATTLLNQGKTTLAESLVSKFKIVGFEPPSSSAAVPATFSVDFTGVEFSGESFTEQEQLWVKIGGDDSAVFQVMTMGEVESAEQFAQYFESSNFTCGGKTYSASVDNAKVTFTATDAGAADSIPARINIYTDESMTAELELPSTPAIAFVNGKDAMTAADSLVDAIKQFQSDEDDDWYYLMTDKDDEEYVKALAKYADATEPTEAELGAGIEDHRKFYMGQTCNKQFACETARAAVIYTDPEYLSEEPDASYTGNVAPFYPNSVTWKFKRPQNGNASSSEGTKMISLPKLTDAERDMLDENHVNYLTEEYKRQYVKEGVCLNGEFIDTILGGDWVTKRMRDLLYEILLTNATIEYSDAGFGLVSTAVLQTLAEATDLGIIARDQESGAGMFSVVIPKYSESTEEQRRNRIMPDITWEAQFAGAIHQVKSKGALRASL